MNRRTLLGVAGASLAGLSGCLGEPEYSVTDATVDAPSAPVSVEVDVLDPNAVVEHPARLEFTVRNDSSRPVRLRNTGIWPFGILKAVESLESNSSSGTVLWTDRYRESEYVDATSRRNYGTESTPIVRTLSPDASQARVYELHGDDVRRATSVFVRGWPDPPLFEYGPSSEDSWTAYTPDITVALESRGIL
jgi:hypothetical protein